MEDTVQQLDTPHRPILIRGSQGCNSGDRFHSRPHRSHHFRHQRSQPPGFVARGFQRPQFNNMRMTNPQLYHPNGPPFFPYGSPAAQRPLYDRYHFQREQNIPPLFHNGIMPGFCPEGPPQHGNLRYHFHYPERQGNDGPFNLQGPPPNASFPPNFSREFHRGFGGQYPLNTVYISSEDQDHRETTSNFYTIATTKETEPDPYVPEPISPPLVNHYPILQLYRNSEELHEEYSPQPLPKNRIIKGYSKLRRNSVESSISLSETASSEDGEYEQGRQVFELDAEKLQIVIQDFIRADADTKKISYRSEALMSSTEMENSEARKTDTPLEKKVKVGSTHTRTSDGFYCDEDGFIEVCVYGMLDKTGKNGRSGVSDKAIYSIWYGDGNAWNHAGYLTSGLQSAKGANIQGSEKAVLQLIEKGYRKIKICTESSFMFQNSKKWVAKLSSNSEFQPSNWDEFKYADEIRRLALLSTEVEIKWILVDPTCCGVKKAKYCASRMKNKEFSEIGFGNLAESSLVNTKLN